jgi:hypothetical protein
MDGVRLHPHQALAMTREQALETLLVVGSEDDKHNAALMLAGPVLTPADMQNLQYYRPMPSRMTLAIWFARNPKLRGMVCAA